MKTNVNKFNINDKVKCKHGCIVVIFDKIWCDHMDEYQYIVKNGKCGHVVCLERELKEV